MIDCPYYLWLHVLNHLSLDSPEDRRDFNTEVIFLVYDPDEGNPVIRKTVRIGITDDLIDEANSEIFVAFLQVTNSSSPVPNNQSEFSAVICRITDDDGKFIEMLLMK